MIITKDLTIDELLTNMPSAVSYFMKHGIKTYVSGNPVWGTIEELALRKGYTEADVDKFVKELIDLYNKRSHECLK